MRPLLHSAIALILTTTQFGLSILTALVRALLLQRRPGDNRLSQRLQRFACTAMMLVMLSNTALAGPVVSQAMATTVLISVVEWQQGLWFWWRASGWEASAARFFQSQPPKGWDGKGAPKLPPLKEQPQETAEERAKQVARVKVLPEGLNLQTGAPVILQAIALDVAGNPVSGVIVTWSGEDVAKKKPLPVKESLVTEEAIASARKGVPPDADAAVSRKGEFVAAKAGAFKVIAEIAGQKAEVSVQAFGALPAADAPIQTGEPVGSGDIPKPKNKTSQVMPGSGKSQRIAADLSGSGRIPASGGSDEIARKNTTGLIRPAVRYAKNSTGIGNAIFGDSRINKAVAMFFQGGGYGDPSGWNDGNYTTSDDPGKERSLIGGHAPVSGNTNFQFAAPVISLDGRGVDLSLAMTYNSRIWHKAHNYYSNQDEVTFNIDHDWPAPGWNLGFGKIINMGNDERTGNGGGFMLVDADGTRHPYRGTPSIPYYQPNWTSYPCINCDSNSTLSLTYNGFTTDGTLTNYNVMWQRRNPYYGCQSGPTNCVAPLSPDYQPAPYATAQLPNGTTITYGAAAWTMQGAARVYSNAIYPTQITDASGNYITISYLNNQGPNIDTITDTLGRVIQFHYDSTGLLTAITAPAYDSANQSPPNNRRVISRFQWMDLTLNSSSSNYGFSSSLAVKGGLSSIKTLKAIYYPATHTGYWFGETDSYSTYGMLMKVLEKRALNSTLNGIGDSLTTQPSVTGGSMSLSMSYNYPTGSGYALTTEPSFTQMSEDWVPNATGGPAVTSYSVTENASERTVEITRADGLRHLQVTDNNINSDYYGLIKRDETWDGTTTMLARSIVTWQNTKTDANYWSPRPLRTEVTDERGQVTATDYYYGTRHNQLIETREYDYGGTTLLRRTATSYLNDVTSNYDTPHIFRLVSATDMYDASNNRVARTEYGYDESSLQALNGAAAVNHSSPANAWRGQVTSVKRYADAEQTSPSNYVNETRTYDVCGNVVTVSTSCCEQTKFTYNKNTEYTWPETITRGSATDPTKQNKTTATYDVYTGLVNNTRDADHQNPSLNAFRIEYDQTTLRPLREVLPTDAYTYHIYSDDTLNVIDLVYEAGKQGYDVASRSDRYLDGYGRVHGETAYGKDYAYDNVLTVYDAYGRVWKQTRPYRSWPTSEAQQWTIYEYDKQDRLKKTTAPDGSVTERFYNEAAYPSVATAGAPGQTARVRDQWGRERWARSDAFNRLAEVVEPDPNGNGAVTGAGATQGYLTSYSYDGNNLLKQINQGDQVRKFKYDTLGRMTHQKLAERDATINDSGQYVGSGTWSDYFLYDNRSNLIQRTDARGVRINFNYNNDPLNRLQTVVYDKSGAPTTANIPAAANLTYQYVTSGDLTRLNNVWVSDGMGNESFTYDAEARLQIRTQTFAGKESWPLAFDYSYDTLNRVTQQKYPAQWNVAGTPRKNAEPFYDMASRPVSLNYNGSAWAQTIEYNAASQTLSLNVGTQMAESYSYDPQTGLLTNQKVKQGTVSKLDLSYDYNNASNQKTGQLVKLTDHLNNSRSRGFSYDKLARLKQATGGSDPINNPAWTQTYSYDRYGNRTNVTKTGSVALDAINPGGNASSLTLSYTNAQSQTLSNRITTTGYEYDEAGNLTRGQDTDGTWQRYRYDAAGRLAQILNDSSAMLEYQRYGAGNQRLLMQHWNGSETYYGWEGGSVAAEYSGTSGLTWQKSYVYLGGRLLLTENPTNQYQLHHPDRLGTRLVTNASDGTILSEQTHLPYGAAMATESSGTATNRRFTSYDRSATTKLDYAVNRFYNAGLGRFTQVDPIGMSASSLSDPQSLNLYDYCGNDPVNHVDPDGLFFKKLFRAILKFLANKWVQLALGVALAVLSMGSGSFIIHNYSLKAGFGIARTTAITAKGWAAIGLSTAQGVGSVNSLVQSQARRKAEEDKGGKFSKEKQQIVDKVRAGALSAIENNPACAQLLGGWDNGTKLVSQARTLNAHTINPTYKGTQGRYPDVVKSAIRDAGDQGSTIYARSEISIPGLKGFNIYLNDRFFSISTLDGQITAYIHELRHLNGLNPGVEDTAFYKDEYEKIKNACKTGDVTQ